jgi:hypothetical protein
LRQIFGLLLEHIHKFRKGAGKSASMLTFSKPSIQFMDMLSAASQNVPNAWDSGNGRQRSWRG